MGSFVALIALVFSTYLLLFCPCFTFKAVQFLLGKMTERDVLDENIVQLKTKLFKTYFNKDIFDTQDYCAICMMPFTLKSVVSPLPCDLRHYFHAKCIESWLDVRQVCPLCKYPVSLENIQEVDAMIENILIQKKVQLRRKKRTCCCL